MTQNIKAIDEKMKVHKIFTPASSPWPAVPAGRTRRVPGPATPLPRLRVELKQFGRRERSAEFIFHIPSMFHL